MHEKSIFRDGKMLMTWWLPPLRNLESFFIQVLPTVQGHFDWDKFRSWKQASAVSLRASSGGSSA
jgi:hypothetical protein